jgi:hypothetical protein
MLGIYGNIIRTTPNAIPLADSKIKSRRFLFLLNKTSLCLTKDTMSKPPKTYNIPNLLKDYRVVITFNGGFTSFNK